MPHRQFPSLAMLAIALAAGPQAARAATDGDAPRRVAAADLGQDGRITLTPAFTPDGDTIYVAQSECSPIWECPQRLKRSHRTTQGWSAPERVALPVESRVDWPSVSPDGRTLWFSWAKARVRDDGSLVYEDFDLYTLDLTDPQAVPRAVDGADINRVRGGAVRTLRFVHNETAPSLTRDGDLYFWTERLDGIGERDVYIARRDPRGCFRTAEPVPPPVNSRGRDDGAWVDPEGTTMLVTYNGRGGSGGADLFLSRKVEGRWTDPVNLGPAVNSPFEDFAARLTPDRKHLVFTSTRPFGDQAAGLLQVWTIAVADIPVLRDSEREP